MPLISSQWPKGRPSQSTEQPRVSLHKDADPEGNTPRVSIVIIPFFSLKPNLYILTSSLV